MDSSGSEKGQVEGRGGTDYPEYLMGPLVLRSCVGPSAYEKRTLRHTVIRNVD